MFAPIKNVVLIGGSGQLGRPILDALLAAKPFKVTVLSRKDSTSALPNGVTVKKVDYDNAEELLEAFKGQDAVVSTIAVQSVGLQAKIIEAASRAGVKRFIPSDFGGDLGDKLPAVVPAFRGKREVVKILQSCESKGLSWTTFGVGPFFDLGLRSGRMGIDLNKRTMFLYDADAPAAFTANTLAQIARAVVGVLEHPGETANRRVYTSSFTLTLPQLHAALERVSGGTWRTTNKSTQDLEKEGKEALSQGQPIGMNYLIRVTLFRQGFGADFGLHQNDNKLLGLEEEDLDAVIRQVLA